MPIYPSGGPKFPIFVTGTVASTIEETLYQWQYDFQETEIYVGYAPRGVATGSTEWTVKKIGLDDSGNPSYTVWAVGISWSGRTGGSYS